MPPKVEKLYNAVRQLIEEGTDVVNIKVSSITELAGIGKGTAYEYFDSKEDLVACAVVYHVAVMMDWLGRKFHDGSTFPELLDFMLDEMDTRNCKIQAFFWFVHILTDNTEISRLIRQKMESEEFKSYAPLTFLRTELAQRQQKGEVRDDQPVDYQVYVLISHLATYMMAAHTKRNFRLDVKELRPLIYKGVLKELCEKDK